MSAPIPPHYRSFRIALVVVVLAALAGVVWWIAQTGTLTEILRLLKGS